MAANGRTEKFDSDALLERVDGDRELLGELFQDYLEDRDEHLAKLRQGVAAGDAKRIYEGAHALRGCVANFCATTAFTLATEVQDASSSGDAATIGSKVSRLEKEIDLLTEELRSFLGA